MKHCLGKFNASCSFRNYLFFFYVILCALFFIGFQNSAWAKRETETIYTSPPLNEDSICSNIRINGKEIVFKQIHEPMLNIHVFCKAKRAVAVRAYSWFDGCFSILGGHMEGSIPNGEAKEYYESGELKSIIHIRNNLIDGKQTIYDKNGKMKIEFEWVNNMLKNFETEYNYEGQAVNERNKYYYAYINFRDEDLQK